MRFNPDSTKLLEQKQTLLNQAIKDTEEKYKQLKEAMVIAQQQADKGDLGEEEVRALQRELVETESKLGTLKGQLKSTEKALDTTGNSFSKFSEKAKSAGDKLSGLSSKAGIFLGALVGTVPATQKLRRDLSNLEQNAEASGVGMDKTTEAFKAFNAVSGETDSSVEATSNLLQAGFTKSNLQTAVEGLSGAYQRFPDTLKIESLADSLQETLATGKATGQFGELLDRLGIGADNFSNELAKCKTEAEKQDLALKTLADAGLNDTYKAWQENNKEMVDYENAMFEMQQALTDLGTSIAPIVSAVVNIASQLLDWFNSLPNSIKIVIGAVVAFIASLAPILTVIGNLQKLKGVFTVLGTTISGISAPIIAVIAIIAGLVAAFVTLYNSNENFRNAIQTGWEFIKSTISAVIDQIKIVFQAFVDLINNLWNQWGETIMNLTSTAFQSIKTTIQSVLNIIKNIFQLFSNIIKGNWKGVWNNLSNIVKSIFNIIKNTIKTAFSSIVTIIKSVGSKIGNAVKNAFNSAINFIKSLPSKALQWGRDFIGGLGDGIVSKAKDIVNDVKNIASSIADFLHFSRPDKGPLRYYESWMPDFMRGLAKGIKDNEYLVTDEISNLANKMRIDESSLTTNVNSNFDYGRFGNIMTRAIENMNLKIVMDNREVGRALRGMGVKFS